MDETMKVKREVYNLHKISESLRSKGAGQLAEEIVKIAQEHYQENTNSEPFNPSVDMGLSQTNNIPSFVNTDNTSGNKHTLHMTLELPQGMDEAELVTHFHQLGRQLGVNMHDFGWTKTPLKK